MIRRPLIDLSTAIVRPTLANWGKWNNIAFVCSVFFLSGLVHVPVDIAFWAVSGVPSFPLLWFFCKNLVAIILEVMVTLQYRSYRRWRGWSAGCIRTLERVLGYTWVFLFLCYASPPGLYPILRILGSENHRSLYWTIP